MAVSGVRSHICNLSFVKLPIYISSTRSINYRLLSGISTSYTVGNTGSFIRGRVLRRSQERSFGSLRFWTPLAISRNLCLGDLSIFHHQTHHSNQCSVNRAMSNAGQLSSRGYNTAKHQNMMASQPASEVMNSGLVRSVQQDMRNIYESAVNAVYPRYMIQNALKLSEDGNTLTVDGREYELKNNVYVVGFGKAVSGMARALEDLISRHIVEGIISVPHGTKQLFTSVGKDDLCVIDESRLQVHEGAENNLPDEDAHHAAVAIETLADKLTEKDILIVLISGGGSALLPSPIPPVTLNDELQMTKVVASAAGSIQDLNTLRQNIEVLKGGGLAQIAKPAQVLSLILSDVIEDKLDIISSGPTTPLLSSPRQCLQILERLNVKETIPSTVLETFISKASKKKVIQEVLPHRHNVTSYESNWSHVQNVIIGSNSIATQAALDTASAMNYVPVILTNSLQGEAKLAAQMFAQLAKYIMLAFSLSGPDQGNISLATTEVELVQSGVSKSDLKRVEAAVSKAHNSQSAVCIICGGETTVQVTGTGKGGRNQEMALAFAQDIGKLYTAKGVGNLSGYHTEFLSAGTDGQDGPTDAAGAVVNKYLIPMALSAKMDPSQFLENNDSYTLFTKLKQINCLLQPGLTGTNVMDIQILVVKPVPLV